MNKIFWIDLFCGAGGTSTGIQFANPGVKVVACVNHDALAIKSHFFNHPNCEHFNEDVRDLAVVHKLKKLVSALRKKHPNCKIALWASLECTNYSKTKGGLPRDADSRSLANSMFPYLEILNPDFFYVENVREFMSWGELDSNGRPISMDKGKLYQCWKNKIKSMGYDYGYRILNAADYVLMGTQTDQKKFIGNSVEVNMARALVDANYNSQLKTAA